MLGFFYSPVGKLLLAVYFIFYNLDFAVCRQDRSQESCKQEKTSSVAVIYIDVAMSIVPIELMKIPIKGLVIH